MQSLLIAVPTMGGIMKSATTDALLRLMKMLTRAGVDVDYSNIDSSDIVLARNIYANSVLDSDKWQGLLFIDSDMFFLPRLVGRMLKADFDAAAVAYVKRNVDWEKLGRGLAEHGDLERARAEASQFVLKGGWLPGEQIRVKRRAGFATMAAAGMGCTLISKKVLQAMVDAQVVSRRKDGSRRENWGFFDHIEANGEVYSEDYSFWYRWTHMMKRDLWVCIDEEVTHIGQFNYQAKFTALDRMRGAPSSPSSSSSSSS